MDKENVAYTYNGILFSLYEEGNSITCYNKDEHEDIMLNEMSVTKDKYR